jgi:hypothetical protein
MVVLKDGDTVYTQEGLLVLTVGVQVVPMFCVFCFLFEGSLKYDGIGNVAEWRAYAHHTLLLWCQTMIVR